MSKHSNRENEVLLYLQKHYQGSRFWRFDNGQAYAKFSMIDALKEFKRTGSITQAKNKLRIITYGTVGFPDLFGIYKGIGVGIEIKVGKDKQRKEQKVMENVINKSGGIYMLVDDKSPLADQLKPMDGIKAWATTL